VIFIVLLIIMKILRIDVYEMYLVKFTNMWSLVWCEYYV